MSSLELGVIGNQTVAADAHSRADDALPAAETHMQGQTHAFYTN